MWNKIQKIYIWTDQVRPKVYDIYYSDANRNEYQNLVDTVWSVQFVDSGKRYRFIYPCYIWDRIALNFNWTTMTTVNLDDFSSSSKTISVNVSSRVWYFGENRILTSVWILDFQWNVITSFSYKSITPWLPWVVRANDWYDIYKWEVNWDNITFTKIWTWGTDQTAEVMCYWRLWAYLINSNDTQWSWNSSYINPTTNAITNFTGWSNWRMPFAYAWPDGKLYRETIRYNWWGRMQKIWTWDEWFVWDSLSTSWSNYGRRSWHFLWNFVSWWMNRSSWQWTWYWSNSYFIDTSWTFTKVQENAFAYDSEILSYLWFIDENWRIYPYTGWWWSWVILKTDKTFTKLNRANPFLWR